ncbi:MAG: phosphomannomutase/phosphoglucomutase [Anaerolineales bacterium]
MKLEPSIFKKYDIRGTAMGPEARLTTRVAEGVGLGFARYLKAAGAPKRVVVGYDNRHTSPDLATALAGALRANGYAVVWLGRVPTPVVYWYAVQSGGLGAVMVTGSHLPPDQNGFKLSIGKDSLYGAAIMRVRELAEEGPLSADQPGDLLDLTESIQANYSADLRPRVGLARPVRVVLDAGNGMGGVFAPGILQTWGAAVVECLYCEPNPDFPNHPADPQNAANLADLAEAVRAHGADIGFAFDGDADRVGAVDHLGNSISADRLLALLAREMLARHPGARVVADVLSSEVLFSAVRAAGGEAIMCASGHSIVKAEMARTGALLGGEMSGHIFIADDYLGFDDGLLVAGRLLQLLTAQDATLADLNAQLPTLYSTPEYRPACPDDQKASVIAAAAAHFAGDYPVNTVDGVRVTFENGWGLLRASHTEPVLSMRFEGATEADALAYRAQFFDIVRAYIPLDDA